MNRKTIEARKKQATKLINEQRFDEALSLYQQICRHADSDVDAWRTLGALSGQLGLLDEAETACRRALEIDGTHTGVLQTLGKILHQKGDSEQATAIYQRLRGIRPDDLAMLESLGLLYQEQKHYHEAVDCFRQRISLQPGNPVIYNYLGNCLVATGDIDNATSAFRVALQRKPDYVDALVNLGNLLQASGDVEQALRYYERALQLQPSHAVILNNIGNACYRLGRNAEAIEFYHRALRIRPDYAAAYNNLGNALQLRGDLGDAIKNYRLALRHQPDYPSAWNNLGSALQYQGKLAESRECFRKALSSQPDFMPAQSGLLLAQNYDAGLDKNAVYQSHLEWGRRFPASTAHKEFRNEKNPDKLLKIGYVSPDFRDHPVASFVTALFEQRVTNIETYCYADVAVPDSVTRQLQGSVGQWRNSAGMSDDRLADLIENDGIDILVDLAGHTANNRLPLFARRVTPVQVSYLGYPNTTGLATMDYRITDAWADPEGESDGYYTETLLRLPGGFLCYTPPSDTPLIQRPMIRESGHVTFASFNNLAKVSETVIELWAEILAALPGASLLLKNGSLADSETRELVLVRFAKRGIGPSRLELVGRVATRTDHLAMYNRVDIAFDTFPYHGATTTCEALWMGVPVVTLAGEAHASRVGVSLLNQIGMQDFIAESAVKYKELAFRLANNSDRLEVLHATLRDNMRRSSLCDGARFRKEMATVFRRIWKNWCAS